MPGAAREAVSDHERRRVGLQDGLRNMSAAREEQVHRTRTGQHAPDALLMAGYRRDLQAHRAQTSARHGTIRTRGTYA